MKAMILAAGRGERLRPLTEQLPKPLIDVRGQPVIAYTLTRLAKLGVEHIIINACYLAEKLIDYVGDGSAWGVRVTWSRETTCLDTGGGVVHALRHVGNAPLLVVNGDILWNVDLRPLLAAFDPHTMDALLGVVVNPADSRGDFFLWPWPGIATHPGPLQSPFDLLGVAATQVTTQIGQLQRTAEPPTSEYHARVTYSGIQMLRPQAFASYPDEPFSLNRFYDDALQAGRLRGLLLHGQWADMGTLERLAEARKREWTLDHF